MTISDASPSPNAATPQHRTGAEIIADTLKDIPVTTIFCYPGGANLEILDALSKVGITLIRTEHEQGAVFAAQGYARASGLLGVCLATSGPGATNLVTGIADANSDSIPILAITGNVATRWLGKNAFQEVDIVSITRPITKHAEQIKDARDIEAAIRRAARLACAGRPGPVVLDFPKDIQQTKIAPLPGLDSKTIAQAGPIAPQPQLLSHEILRQILDLFKNATKPVIYAGGGVIAAGASVQLTQLAAALDCPVVLTLMGLGAMDSRHPLFLGPLGMHGACCANVAVNEADLVLALGVRFDDRVIGNPEAFAAEAKIVHIDIDPNELGKNKTIHLGICADLRQALVDLASIAVPINVAEWRAYLARVDMNWPLIPASATGEQLTGANAIATLGAHLPPNSLITTGVGQHQMWAMQFLKPARPRQFLSSAGFGTMGFGLPAAIGAKCAMPNQIVVDIDGDGSLNMTINELATCRRYAIGVKIFVINNQSLGMVRQWQDLIYDGNRVLSSSEDPYASADRDPFPNFLAIAAGYRIPAARARTHQELIDCIARLLHDPHEPFLLDVIVETENDVFPMIPAGKTYRDVVFDKTSANIYDT